MKRFATAMAVGSILLAAGSALGGDVLRIQNGGAREKGVIVDGLLAGEFVNDGVFQEVQTGSLLEALFPVVPLANFTPSGQDEIIAFAGRRPPRLQGVTWTAGNDSVPVTFEDEYRIAVHAWVLASPFDDLRSNVAVAGTITSMVWANERTGLAFDTLEIVDATGDPDAGQFLDFTCGLDGAIKEQIGFVEGAINLYYVDTVDFGSGPATTNGVFCWQEDLIGMGRNTGGYLLLHELGHAFTLGHTESMTEEFDSSNIMHSYSADRRFFTEGQTFRAIFNPGSDVNALYDVRDGQPTRFCSHSTSTDDADCPPLNKRIWSDGTAWPPN